MLIPWVLLVLQLITGAGSGPLTGMLGIGGRPAPTANDRTNLSSTAGYSSCTGDETGVDAETCRQCKCPSFTQGTDCHPCLYNVEEDPGVRALGTHARAVPPGPADLLLSACGCFAWLS